MEVYRRLSGFFVLVIAVMNFTYIQSFAEGLRSQTQSNPMTIIKTPEAEVNSTQMPESNSRDVASDSLPLKVQIVENREVTEDSLPMKVEVIENRDIASEENQKKTKVKAESETAIKENKTEKKELFYMCTKQRETRWLRLYNQSDGRCKTVYSKTGNAEEVSTAYNYEACEAVLKNIKENLEKGDFKCEEKTLMGALDIE